MKQWEWFLAIPNFQLGESMKLNNISDFITQTLWKWTSSHHRVTEKSFLENFGKKLLWKNFVERGFFVHFPRCFHIFFKDFSVCSTEFIDHTVRRLSTANGQNERTSQASSCFTNAVYLRMRVEVSGNRCRSHLKFEGSVVAGEKS